MKEIKSKLTGKVQIVSDETWADIKAKGRAHKYTVRNMPKIEIKKPVMLPERKVAPKKNKDD